MNPLMKNKVDLSTLSEEEKAVFQKYGRLPSKGGPLGKGGLAAHRLAGQERKYFDSGDYMMNKAGVMSDTAGGPLKVGTAIPTPEHVQHASPPSLSASPTNSSAAAGGASSFSGMMAAGVQHPSSVSLGGVGGHHASASSPAQLPGNQTQQSPHHPSSASTGTTAAAAPSGLSQQQPSTPGSSSSSGASAGAAGTPPAAAPSSPRASMSIPSGGGGEGGITHVQARRPSQIGGSSGPGGGVGVGGIAIPGASGSFGAKDGSRVSPPISFSPLSSGVQPSSFPIQSSHHHPHPNNHHHLGSSSGSSSSGSGAGGAGGHPSIGHGSSPVKPSGLAIGSSGEGTDGIDEMAVDDAET